MASEPPELPEQDFIHEEPKKNKPTFLVWLIALVFALLLIWGARGWYLNQIQEKIAASPFLQVKNREISLFLWQFPEHFRSHATNKSGYLPAFQYQDRVVVDPELADSYAIAPPQLLFLYHTWKRLLSSYYSSRPISVKEFQEFLSYDEQWKPQFWQEAPEEYVRFVASLSERQFGENLDALPNTTLPIVVRQAFQGWKNYFKEGNEINALRPTYRQIREFLVSYPNYMRNFWRNIVADTTPHYLISLYSKSFVNEEEVPQQELTAFLKVAYYNYYQSRQVL